MSFNLNQESKTMKKTVGLLFLSLLMLAFIPKNDPIRIVIDAGHGGQDHGASHQGLYEKDIVDAITSKIKSQNKNANIILHFTRDGDEFVSLGKRANEINEIKPDLVLSLHVSMNGNSAASGFEVFIPKESAYKAKASELAEKLATKFQNNINLKLRGIKEAPFFILKKSESPALLVELGFISNPHDRNLLTDDAQQTQIANTILEFLGDLK